MKEIMKIRARRIFRRQEEYSVCFGWQYAPPLIKMGSPIKHHEELISIYVNRLHSVEDLILITDKGIHWRSAEGWLTIKYEEIAGTGWPLEPKEEAKTLVIKMRSGETIHIPVRGEGQAAGDVFTMMTFLNRLDKFD